MTTITDRPKPSSVSLRACFVEPFAAFMAFLLVFQSIAAAQSPVAQSPVALERKANPLGLIETMPGRAMANTSITSGPGAAPARIVPPAIRAAGGVLAESSAVTAKSISANCVYQGANYIIQYVCTGNRVSGSTPPDSGLLAALQQFESDSIKQWLALFNLPNGDTDVAFFYQVAQGTSRNSVRAYMLLRMADIAYRLRTKNAVANGIVSANESTAYNWFQGRVQARLVQMDQDAVNDKNSWQSNRCTWQPDPDLEKTYGFFYIPCVGTQIFDTAPNADYFTGAALKKDFNQVLVNLNAANAPTGSARPAGGVSARGTVATSKTPNGTVILDAQSDATAELLGGFAGSTGGVFGLAIGFGLIAMTVPKLRSSLFPARNKGESLKNMRANKNPTEKPQDVNKEVEQNAEDAKTEGNTNGDTNLESDVDALAKNLDKDEAEKEIQKISTIVGDEAEDSSEAGPEGTLIGIAIAIVTTIVIIISDEASAENSLGALDATLNKDSANPPDLMTMLSDQVGNYQVSVCWTEATWPDRPGTSPLGPTAVLPSDPVVVTYPSGSPNNFQVNNFTYVDWGGADISVVSYGGYLIKSGRFNVPPSLQASGVPAVITGNDVSPIMEFINWNGDNYWAMRVGVGWVVGKRFPLSSDIDCPAGPSGLTEMADVSNCRSFVANSLQVVDSNAVSQVMLISTRPTVTPSRTEVDFVTTEPPITVPVAITGFPLPTVTIDNLPTGATFNTNVDGKGTMTFSLDGTKVKPGTYATLIHATNYSQETTVQLNFVITGPDFEAPPVFDSYDQAHRNFALTTGLPFNLPFHVISAYTVSWSTNIPLPLGMEFVSSGSNLLALTGTPPVGSATPPGFTLHPNPNNAEPYIQACDGQNRCIQLNIFVTIADAPRAQFISPMPLELDFPVGQPRSYTLSTTGAITAVSFSTSPSCPFPGPPSWVTTTDNGNGSVTFTGTAPDNQGVDQVNLADVVIHTAGLADLPCNTNNLQFFLDSNPQLFLNSLTMSVGQNWGLFFDSTVTNVTTSAGDIQLSSPLPAGITFSGPASFGPWNMGGNAQPGTGGQYNLAFQMTAIKGLSSPVTQNFLLTINEPPSWPGSSSIGGIPFISLTMMSGVNNQYVFKPAGFPTYNGMSITRGAGFLPTGVIFTAGTEINPNSGGAVLKGNPAASTIGQSYVIPVIANNGIGNPATMDVFLTIVPPGDVTGDGKVDCSDVTMVKAHLNAKAGTANYNGAADVNGDGVVNILDLAFVTAHLAQGTVCH